MSARTYPMPITYPDGQYLNEAQNAEYPYVPAVPLQYEETNVARLRKYVVSGNFQEFNEFVETMANIANQDASIPHADFVWISNYYTLKMFDPGYDQMIFVGNYQENPVYQKLQQDGLITACQNYLSLAAFNNTYNQYGKPLA